MFHRPGSGIEFLGMKPPAFQFYPDDFIGGTVALTTVDVGAYMRLLCYQWGNGKIPIEKSAVDRVAGCPVSDEVMAKFPNRRNKRLESERKKQADYREKQRQNGLASGRARRSTTVQPPFNHRPTKLVNINLTIQIQIKKNYFL